MSALGLLHEEEQYAKYKAENAAALRPWEELKLRVFPHLQHYQDDFLIHDCCWFRENPGVPCILVVRDSGTHLAPMHAADSDYFPEPGQYKPYLCGSCHRSELLGKAREVLEFFRPEREGYSYTGSVLFFEVDAAGCVRNTTYSKALLALKKYESSVCSEWFKGY